MSKARGIPDPNMVVISYIHPHDKDERKCLLTRADARKHWEALSEPLRDTYRIRDAEPSDWDDSDWFMVS